MKSFIKAINIIIALSLVISVANLASLQVIAMEIVTDEQVVFEADYRDDSIIVVLTNEASLRFNEYDVSDFDTIDAKGVRNLSESIGEKVQQTIKSVEQLIVNESQINAYTDVNLGKYKQIVCIDLNETGRDKVLAAIKELQGRDDVEYVGPNYIYQLSSSESIIEYDDTYSNLQWEIDRLSLEEAWAITTGSSSVTVGVIDSGIEGTHDDLEGNINIAMSRDFTSGFAVSGGITPTYNHGTGVAGVIGARGNNSFGTAGVSWYVNLVSLQITNSLSVSADKIAAAILYAQSIGIDILNISANVGADDGGINNAIAQFDGLVVCSAGNYGMSGKNIDESPTYPASYNLVYDNMIVVGAATRSNGKISSSNWGASTVDLFAPGEDIYTSGLNNSYQIGSQTSYATPFVTGVAALMLSVNPNLTPQEIKHMILAGVDNDVSTEIRQGCVSSGVLNALAAVEYARDHVVIYSSLGASGHMAYCVDCGFEMNEEHSLYMYEDNGDDGCIVKCNDCSYVINCPEAAEYEYYDNYEHYVSCPSGEFSFFESHSYIYPSYTSAGHTATCSDCGYSQTENHTWVQEGLHYRCSLCGATSNGDYINTPPEEELTE